jgi:glycogen operon protein
MRERMKKNLLATLLLSQGVPMVVGGDEMGRTQHGNNNAYAQDNEISWIDWDPSSKDRELLRFAREVVRIREDNPVLRRRTFLTGRPIEGSGTKDLSWLRPDGGEMQEGDWGDTENHVLGMLLHGRATDEVDERGRPSFGQTVLMLLNGGTRSRPFTLPKLDDPGSWRMLINTAQPGQRVVKTESVNLVAHSFVLLRYEERPGA